jgi:predicted dienelactone hydrolase
MRKGLAVAVTTLLLAAASAAQDACLTGASTLGDQRALGELRAATEASCPCATFAAPRGRHAYRHCARMAIKTALNAGELRRECLRTARELYYGSICGTNRVACGGFAEAEREVRCRLAAPSGRNQCDGEPGRVETACDEQTHCADVIDWTAGTCVDPRRQGPYGIGVRTIQYTKDSVVNPGTPRVLTTLVWYPTTPGAGPVDAGLRGVVDAPLDLSGAPYPLLMFSHGSCGYALQSSFLTPLIASYGYVVASPPHPGNTLNDFPNCRTPTAQGVSLQERPNDIIFVADELLAANQDAGSPFFDAIDPARLGMSGHSFGGLTTYLVSARDARFRVAIPLAPAALFDPTLTVPSLSMMGAIDGTVNNDQTRAAYDRSSAPKIQVEIGRAGHYAFSDACFPSPDCNPPATLTQDEAHAAVLRWVVPFLQRYLKGDASYEPFLAAVPPGVSVMQDR